MANNNKVLLLIMAFLWVSSDYCMKSGNANHFNNGPIHDNDDGSLVPSRPCKRPNISPEANPWGGGPSLVVMNRWCGVEKANIPSEAQLLRWGADRVRSIQARLAAKRGVHPDAVALDAYPGSQFKSASFVVEVGLGSPPQQQHLIFDTGSEITWVQCKTCRNCFKQTDPLYDPSKSTTMTCGSPDCRRLPRAEHGCGEHSRGCQFKIAYADGTTISGDFLKDKLTLSNQVVKNDYIFGCANHFQDAKVVGSSGIIGLANEIESIIRQAGHEFGPYFSYCLPTGRQNLGHLTFGPSERLRSRSRIPIKIFKNKKSLRSEYLVALEGIMVDKRKLSIPKKVFLATEGTLVDSGTTLTYLPPEAYRMLRDAFKMAMKSYNHSLVPGDARSGLEVCYELTNYPTPKEIPIPKISFIFSEGAVIQLSDQGTMGGKLEKRCLMFVPNETPAEASIIGSHAQQTFDIIYDLNKHEIQFGPQGCK